MQRQFSSNGANDGGNGNGDDPADETVASSSKQPSAAASGVERYADFLEHILHATTNADTLAELMNRFKDERDFDALHLAAVLGRHVGGARCLRLEAQALIEMGFLDDARDVARRIIIAYPEDQAEQKEALGLIGRCYKQAYMDGCAEGRGDENQLHLAFETYFAVYNAHKHNALWHGINALALLCRSDRDNVRLRPGIDRAALARAIIAAVDERSALVGRLEPREDQLNDTQRAQLNTLRGELAWDYATGAEACLAIPDLLKARSYLAVYVDATSKPFELESTLRQFIEVWELEGRNTSQEAHDLLLTMRSVLSRAPGASVELTKQEVNELATRLPFEANDPLVQAEDRHFERVFGQVQVRSMQWWIDRWLSIARATARVELDRVNPATNEPFWACGSGFLADGAIFHPGWQGERVFVTNEHVVSPLQSPGDRLAIAPAQAQVRFTFADETATYKIAEILWFSPRDAHDVSIFRLQSLPDNLEPIRDYSTQLPECDRVGGNIAPFYVTAIGHAGGGQLALGIDNPQLWHHDGPCDGSGRPVRLHYHAPTQQGNSGSPVFEWPALNLIGVHHAGRGALIEYPGETTAPIGRRGRKSGLIKKRMIEANEAIGIGSVREAIQRFPAGWRR